MSARNTDLSLLAPPFRACLDRVMVRLQRDLDLSLLDVFEAARSPGRQRELYERGRDPSKDDFGRTVTRAHAYQSAHQFGLAVDLVFRTAAGGWTWDEPTKGSWDKLHAIAREEGLEPLSFEKPHIQLAGFNWKSLPKGPMDTVAWEAWLRAGGAFPTVRK